MLMKPVTLHHSLLLVALSAVSWAQTVPPTSTIRPIEGVGEITIAGSGGTNREFSDSFGGISGSYAVYFNNEWQGVIRQSLNYTNPSGAGTRWHGSTRVGADYNFTELGMLMPFVGASFGRIYGTALKDSWSAGIDVGSRYYVGRRMFVFGMLEYNWLFERGRDLDNNFGRGQILFSTGLGFNF